MLYVFGGVIDFMLFLYLVYAILVVRKMFVLAFHLTLERIIFLDVDNLYF